MAISIRTARRQFAEELRHTARLRSRALINAIATTPREHFVGPGPWRILSPMNLFSSGKSASYWTSDDADPRHLYHDVLIALDEARGLNNGQPSFLAFLLDQLELSPRMHVVHIGAGVGYYSAILAEIVGPTGQVTAIEVDAELAERATANLASRWRQATVIAADGFSFIPDRPADAIFVNAGVSHLSPVWFDALAANGRLLVALTNGDRQGGFLLIKRDAGKALRYPVRYVSDTGIFPCVGGRDPDAEERLKAALARSSLAAVRSLRRAPEEPDETCWLAGAGWWLSTAAVEGSRLS